MKNFTKRFQIEMVLPLFQRVVEHAKPRNQAFQWHCEIIPYKRARQLVAMIGSKAPSIIRGDFSETARFRFKTILGEKIASRAFKSQVVEVRLKSQILNRMSQLGMPEGYIVS